MKKCDEHPDAPVLESIIEFEGGAHILVKSCDVCGLVLSREEGKEKVGEGNDSDANMEGSN